MTEEYPSTRMALVEQKQEQLDAWLKDVSKRIDDIHMGVNNHLTEMHQMFDEFKASISAKMMGILVSVVMVLIGVIASYVKN